jgi:hypothetical protein
MDRERRIRALETFIQDDEIRLDEIDIQRPAPDCWLQVQIDSALEDQ